MLGIEHSNGGLIALPGGVAIRNQGGTIEDGRIELRGFGILQVTRWKARKARNPHTGEKVTVPECKRFHSIRLAQAPLADNHADSSMGSGFPPLRNTLFDQHLYLTGNNVE